MIRGQHVLQGIHEVLCGDGGNDLAVVVHPVLFPQGEGPSQAVGIPVPLGGQTFPHDALVVVLHQGVHAVGAHDHFQIGGGGQVVQGGGLAGIEDGVFGGVHTACGCTGITLGAAAAAQQTGCTGACGCQTAGLEELTARNRSTHNKFPLFFMLQKMRPARLRRPAAFPCSGDKKRRNGKHPLRLCNSPPDHSRVVKRSIASFCGGVNCFRAKKSAPRGQLSAVQGRFPLPLPRPAAWRPPRRRVLLPARPDAPWRGPRPPPAAFWCGS